MTITQHEFHLLRDLIESQCGIQLGDEKEYLIESRLTRLMVENACQNFGEFYLKLKYSEDEQLMLKIVDAMTTKETLWFRDEYPYQILQEIILPQYGQELIEGKRDKVRMWSAACSTGQEPYSVAMTINEYVRKGGKPASMANGDFHITATDISPSALFLAKHGRYDPLSMSRGLPPELRERYFTAQGNFSVINPELKTMIDFQSLNLMDNFHALGLFDIVFIRNVAIYFSTEFKQNLFQKVAQQMKPGGYLFLGGSESLVNISQAFKLIENSRGFYYQKL